MNKVRRKLAHIAHRRKPSLTRAGSTTGSALAEAFAALTPTRTALKSFDYCDGAIFQGFQIVWLNTDDAGCHNYADSDAIATLRHIANCTNAFADVKECTEYIDQVEEDESVFVVLSGPSVVSVMPAMHRLAQVTSIYILCENKLEYEQWVSQWRKVKSVCMDMALLCIALRQAALECDRNSTPMSFIEANAVERIPGLDQVDDSFTYTRLIKDITAASEFTEQNVKDFIAFYRQQVLSNTAAVKSIDRLEREYRDYGAIWWYTSPCFLYSMLHRAFRTMAMETIIKMSFFVRDLEQQIRQLHDKQNGNHFLHRDLSTPVVFYRGQGITQANFEQLKNTQGGLVSFNIFLFATKNRHLSLSYAHQAVATSDLLGVLFVLTIDPSVSSTPYAHIRDVCCTPTDEEILFSLQPIFRIEQFKQIDAHSDRLWQVELTLTERSGEETPSNEYGWSRLNDALLEQDRYDDAQQVCRSALLQTSDEKDRAALYYQRALTEFHQENYNEAIVSYMTSLEIRQRILDHEHVDVAACYTGIGLTHETMHEYSKALSSFEKALAILRKSPTSTGASLVPHLNNIARVCSLMDQPLKALPYYQEALQFCQEAAPPDPCAVATALRNIGFTHERMDEHDRAISSFEQALAICERSLPGDHPDLAEASRSLGEVYDKTQQHSIALTYYEKALDIYESMHPKNHANQAATYTNIGTIYLHRANYLYALNSYEKAHEIYREILPSNHPDLAASYKRQGTVYEQTRKYKKALMYYQKAIDVYKSSESVDTLGLIDVYNRVGALNEQFGEQYSPTAPSFEQTSDIEHHSSHSTTSSSHTFKRSWLSRRRGSH